MFLQNISCGCFTPSIYTLSGLLLFCFPNSPALGAEMWANTSSLTRVGTDAWDESCRPCSTRAVVAKWKLGATCCGWGVVPSFNTAIIHDGCRQWERPLWCQCLEEPWVQTASPSQGGPIWASGAYKFSRIQQSLSQTLYH